LQQRRPQFILQLIVDAQSARLEEPSAKGRVSDGFGHGTQLMGVLGHASITCDLPSHVGAPFLLRTGQCAHGEGNRQPDEYQDQQQSAQDDEAANAKGK
jgi:hypothetical protein